MHFLSLTQISKNVVPRGKTFHAIVSVIAVNIQFSSPNIVLLSVINPGILRTRRTFAKIVSACDPTPLINLIMQLSTNNIDISV